MSDQQQSRDYQQLLTGVFAASLVVANIVAAKLVAMPLPTGGSFTFSAGILPIGIAFLASDLLAERYGEQAARQAVNAAVVAVIVSYAAIFVTVAAPGVGDTSAFASVLGASTPVFVASVVTIVISQHLDVSMFEHLRARSEIRAVRNLGSTGVSQAADTLVFTGLAFIVLPPLFGQTTVPLAVWTTIVVAEYAAKLGIAVLDTPLFYVLTPTETNA